MSSHSGSQRSDSPVKPLSQLSVSTHSSGASSQRTDTQSSVTDHETEVEEKRTIKNAIVGDIIYPPFGDHQIAIIVGKQQHPPNSDQVKEHVVLRHGQCANLNGDHYCLCFVRPDRWILQKRHGQSWKLEEILDDNGAKKQLLKGIVTATPKFAKEFKDVDPKDPHLVFVNGQGLKIRPEYLKILEEPEVGPSKAKQLYLKHVLPKQQKKHNKARNVEYGGDYGGDYDGDWDIYDELYYNHEIDNGYNYYHPNNAYSIDSGHAEYYGRYNYQSSMYYALIILFLCMIAIFMHICGICAGCIAYKVWYHKKNDIIDDDDDIEYDNHV